MFHLARLNSARVASCRLPFGMPRRSLLATSSLRRLVLQCYRSRKAADRTFVAHQPISFHRDTKQQSILIAVRRNRDHTQAITAGLAFHPKFLPCTAPEGHEAALQG